MATARAGTVTLELTPREAKVVYTVFGELSTLGPYGSEVCAIYDALSEVGIDSDLSLGRDELQIKEAQ